MTKSDEELIAAARAVVERWDTPHWKDVPATAVFINRLRTALADRLAARGEPGEAVAWRWRKRGTTNPWIVGGNPIEGPGVTGFYEIEPLYASREGEGWREAMGAVLAHYRSEAPDLDDGLELLDALEAAASPAPPSPIPDTTNKEPTP